MAEQTNGPNAGSLASWIMEKVEAWKAWRDQNYDDRWTEYYRLWRGQWIAQDQNRAGERSRIICPELAQAVETMVAELEDATFIRDRWIDISDDLNDPDKSDMQKNLNLLLEEFKHYGVEQSISECYFNGALYGTGIAKVVVDKITEPVVEGGDLPSIQFKERYCIKVVPISPRNFVIDPNAHSVDEALGCAHDIKVPLSVVQKKIANGTYRNVPLYSTNNEVENRAALGETDSLSDQSQSVRVVEWHGLVPKKFITSTEKLFDNIEQAIYETETTDTTIKATEDVSDGALVEAIVTIINGEHVARAVANPFLMGDRSIVAYQHDTVPNRFWGRGVAEKGYNPQKALDAEIRARIDALGLSTHPMMGIDSTKIPRGADFAVRPGRNILTVGNPSEALMPLKFPPPDPYTFNQTQELREMIQRGTGGYELPANIEGNRMAATSMSMVVGSMIKRSRRTLANIERGFLKPIVQKALWRNMQFNPEMFPAKDYKFTVRASTGIMAREFEQGQLISLLSTVPQESPAFWMLIKGIYENSNIDSRDQMIQFADQMLQNALNPQPPPPDPKVMVDQAKLEFEKAKWEDEKDLQTMKLIQVDKGIEAEAKRDVGEGRMQTATSILQMVKAETEQVRAHSEAMLNVAKAQAEEMKAKMEVVNAHIAALQSAQQGEVAKKEAGKPAEETTSNKETSKPDGTKVTETKVTKPQIDKAQAKADEAAKEESNPLIKQIEEVLAKHLASMTSQKSESPDFGGILEKVTSVLEVLDRKVADLNQKVSKPPKAPRKKKQDVTIERGPDGQVVSVGGMPVQRDEMGRLAGINGEETE